MSPFERGLPARRAPLVRVRAGSAYARMGRVDDAREDC